MSDFRTDLLNIFTETNMIANPSKPIGRNINSYKSCRLIIYAEFVLLFTINLTTSISLADENRVPIKGSCWSFSHKYQYNVIIYTYCVTAIQINKSKGD